MKRKTEYKVWVHIEEVTPFGDVIRGDSWFEPRCVATCSTEAEALAIQDRVLDVKPVKISVAAQSGT